MRNADRDIVPARKDVEPPCIAGESSPAGPSIVAELRRIEAEIMAHEAAVVELRARSRELLELGTTRRAPSRAVDRATRQRLLRQAAGRRI